MGDKILRQNKFNDFFRHIEEGDLNKYGNHLKSIDFNNIPLLGNGVLTFDRGITIVSGPNGVGKSTLINAIKCGLNEKKALSNKDLLKLKGSTILLTLSLDKVEENKMISVNNLNEIEYSGTDKKANFYSFDPFEIKENLDFFFKQENLKELFEQYSEAEYNNEDLETVSEIIGKKYLQCSFIEIDDESEQSEAVVYFKVKTDCSEYDNTTMGLGELLIFYFYHKTRTLKDHIIIIEEPETFLYPDSQLKLLNYLALLSDKNRNWIILTSHSPILLNNINNNSIKILKENLDNENKTIINIIRPKHHVDYSVLLGMNVEKKGVILVEDVRAQEFAMNWIGTYSNSIIPEYDIISVKSESLITKILCVPKFPNFNIIGIYDGNCATQKTIIENKEINWGYSFLPVLDPDADLQDFTYKNIKLVVNEFSNKDKDFVNTILTKFRNGDPHDWYTNIIDALKMDSSVLMGHLYSAWIKDPTNEKAAKEKFENLQKLIPIK